MVILSNKPPEKLNRDTIMSVAVILNNIKESAKDKLSGNKTIIIYPVEQKSPYIKGLFVTSDMQIMAERSIISILEYLRSQGAIKKLLYLISQKTMTIG